MKISDLLGGIIAIVIGIIFYASAGTLPEYNVKLAGPDFFPKLVALAQIFCAGCLVGLSAYAWYTKKPVVKSEQEEENLKLVGLVMVLTVIYYLAMDVIGFWIATVLYSIALSLLVQERRSIVDAGLTSAGITGVVYGIFSLLLKAALPVGSLFR